MGQPTQTASTTSDIEQSSATGAYRRYVMCLLLGIYVVNFVDRQVVNILAEPIKRDLQLADWQLGMMGGLAFAVLYTILGMPIAMLAERRSRPLIISVAIAVWSGCTALCGLAQNFTQLVLARVGVGVGEAGCTPPAHSLIIDYSPLEKRSSALAFYGMGAPIGSLVGMAFGGLVADAYGWRFAFFLAGAPGVLFAALTFFTLREPRRTAALSSSGPETPRVTFHETLRVLRSKRSFRFAVGAIAIKAFIAIGYAVFMASFFLRNHGEAVGELARAAGGLQPVGFLGLSLGSIAGIFGALGMWCGGKLADRFGSRDVRWYMYGCALAAALFIPPFVLALTTSSLLLALGAMAASAFIGNLHYGPAISATLSVVPPQMRAPASAVQLFVSNLIGLGLGPLAVGTMSDLLATKLGSADGLRWALVIASLGGIVAAAMFWTSARTLREDIGR